MNYQSIFENIIAAILSAALLACIAWVVSWVRNLRLEQNLRELVNPNGVGVSFDPNTFQGAFTLQLHNYSNAAIRIRAIVFIADKFRVELCPAKNQPIHQTPLSNEIARPEFKRQFHSKGSIELDHNPNTMVLSPKTMGIWEVPPNMIGDREWKVDQIYVVFEYATIFGNIALVRMSAPESTVNLVKDNFAPLSKAVHNKQDFDIFHGLKKNA